MGQFIDLTGQRFGRWTVIDRAEDHFTKSGARITMWNCVCDCGKKKSVSGNSLRKGASISCGCITTENLIANKKNEQSTTDAKEARESGCMEFGGQCTNVATISGIKTIASMAAVVFRCVINGEKSMNHLGDGLS